MKTGIILLSTTSTLQKVLLTIPFHFSDKSELPHYYRIEFFLIFSVIRAEHHPHGRICTGFKQTGYAAEQIQMIRFMRRHRSIITQCDRSRDSVASLVSKFGRDHRVIVIGYGKVAAHYAKIGKVQHCLRILQRCIRMVLYHYSWPLPRRVHHLVRICHFGT